MWIFSGSENILQIYNHSLILKEIRTQLVYMIISFYAIRK